MSISLVPYAFSPYTDSWLFAANCVIGYVLGIFLYYCLLKAQYIDPGVLFREFSYEDEEHGFPSDRKVMSAEYKKQEKDNIRQGAHIYKPRYCHTCHIMKPPLASH